MTSVLAFEDASEWWTDDKWLARTARDWFDSRPSERSITKEFRRLAARWVKETVLTSSLEEIVNHPAYRQIVQLGEPALPLILQELQREPNHWHAALVEITGQDPVPENHAGDLDAIAQDWLSWAKEIGISPA